MPGASNRLGLIGACGLVLLLTVGMSPKGVAQTAGVSSTPTNPPIAIKNVEQLCAAIDSEERLYCNLRLDVTVCAASKPEMGVIVVQDATGIELLELGHRQEPLAPGDRILIEGERLLLRRRELGTQISGAPLVDNDGLHAARPVSGEIMLKAGRVPIDLNWFNGFRAFALEVFCQGPNDRGGSVPGSALWHPPTGQPQTEETLLPGLRAECYQGYWEQVPDFDLLQPIKTGSTTNFDLDFRSQDETVALRFTGFFEAPSDGRYTFRVTSDDGSLLFVGPSNLRLTKLGTSTPPVAQAGLIGQAMGPLQDRRWIALAGRATFVTTRGPGLELELRSGEDAVSVKVADAAGFQPQSLLNRYVRIAGVGHAALSGGQRPILDRLFVASGADLKCVEAENETSGATLPLMDIAQIQAMSITEAQLQKPVRIRGVVTAANRSDHWLSLQDDTRGIFVDLHAISNSFPASAELWEVTGNTAKGNFAPVVEAKEIKRLGNGRMPEPARPSWNELANGSMDVQWVEFQGLVSGVHSNVLDLLLPEGPLEVLMENHFEPELQSCAHAVVRVRGTLFAIWNPNTREVQFGSVLMRNGSVNVDTLPLPDPFQAPTKTARQLLLFDSQATPFRPVRVQAQVLYVDAQLVYAVNDELGVRLMSPDSGELHPGDLVEAVGYPEIGGPSPVLRQALIRKTGSAPLPQPRILTGPDFPVKGLDSTLVRVEAKLLAMHTELDSPVLELQSSEPEPKAIGQLVVARLRPYRGAQLSLRLGSKLQLTGVFAATGRRQLQGSQVESFALLLNSPADIVVLSQPSWWTLERLGAVVGFLIVVLMLAAAWITQLRRQVDQRTAQLQLEIRERERAEHHRALEAERARIARDLHDDLGSSLTEIGALASTGQQGTAVAGAPPELFDAIAGKARGSIAALDVIVWAVDPEDNSLQSMADYLSGFAGEYLSHSNIVCRFKIPVSLPELMFEGRIRHDLFLAVKETLNNVVRHAQASEVEFGLVVATETLEISIADNGKGFNAIAATDGNGLKNLRDRLAKLGGSCVIESQLGKGTIVKIRLPLRVLETSQEVAT